MLVLKRLPQEGLVIFDKDDQPVGTITMQYGFRIGVDLMPEYLVMRQELLEQTTPAEFRKRLAG